MPENKKFEKEKKFNKQPSNLSKIEKKRKQH